MRQETFATPGPLRLKLKVQAGEISLDAHETAETVVELEPMRGNDQSREAVEATRIELRERAADGQELVLAVPEKRSFGWGRTPDVRLRISCPEGTSFEVSSASADVEARGRFGSVDVTTASGDLAVDHVGGNAEAKSASGDVRIAFVAGSADVKTASGDIWIDRVAGGADVRSASGDLRIRDAGASVTAQTASGDQRIDAVREGQITLQSASGDLYVGISAGSKLWIDAKSMSGDASSELELGDVPSDDDEAPLVELRATAMSGDIHVARATKA